MKYNFFASGCHIRRQFVNESCPLTEPNVTIIPTNFLQQVLKNMISSRLCFIMALPTSRALTYLGHIAQTQGQAKVRNTVINERKDGYTHTHTPAYHNAQEVQSEAQLYRQYTARALSEIKWGSISLFYCCCHQIMTWNNLGKGEFVLDHGLREDMKAVGHIASTVRNLKGMDTSLKWIYDFSLFIQSGTPAHLMMLPFFFSWTFLGTHKLFWKCISQVIVNLTESAMKMTHP